MSRTTSKKHKIRLEIPLELSGLVQKHFDSYLADASLSDIDVLLLSIYLVEHSQNASGGSYDDAKSTFVLLGRKEDNFRKALHAARDKYVTSDNGTLFFTATGLDTFRKELGQIGKAPVYVIRSGQPFSGIKLFEEFLTSEVTRPELLVCDSYISHVTLFPMAGLVGKVNLIRILTSNIQEPDKFREYKQKLSKEGKMTIAVRTSNKIHDRYLISGKACWSIGASIKDLGNKDTVIRDISEVTSSMRSLFSERWDESAEA